MRYSIEPRDRIYGNGYGFLSFAKNMGTHATKIAKNLSNKYGQKLLDSAKKSTTDAAKTASKRAMQKIAKTTGDLIGNKIADKIASVSKKFIKEYQMMKQNLMYEELLLRKDIYLQKKDSKLLTN